VSKDWYADMQEFHKVVMQDKFPTKPYVPDFKYIGLRKILIREEMNETLDAIDESLDYVVLQEGNEYCLAEIADGIADSIVVLLGTAVTYGIDIRPIWDAVHRANMAKKDGPMREDGKRLKPAGWKYPDIKSEIERQQKC
jgi:predicted HAD superfamily Cof-like phosphohydrolase